MMFGVGVGVGRCLLFVCVFVCFLLLNLLLFGAFLMQPNS